MLPAVLIFQECKVSIQQLSGMSALFNKGNETINETKPGKEAEDKSNTLKSAKIRSEDSL